MLSPSNGVKCEGLINHDCQIAVSVRRQRDADVVSGDAVIIVSHVMCSDAREYCNSTNHLGAKGDDMYVLVDHIYPEISSAR